MLKSLMIQLKQLEMVFLMDVVKLKKLDYLKQLRILKQMLLVIVQV